MFTTVHIYIPKNYPIFDQLLFLTSSVVTKAEEPEQIQEETIIIEPLEIGKLSPTCLI